MTLQSRYPIQTRNFSWELSRTVWGSVNSTSLSLRSRPIQWRRSFLVLNATSKEKKVTLRNGRETSKRKEAQARSARTMTFPQTEIEGPSKDSLSGIATLADTPQSISLLWRCAQSESWKRYMSLKLSQKPIRHELMSWATTKTPGASTIVWGATMLTIAYI